MFKLDVQGNDKLDEVLLLFIRNDSMQHKPNGQERLLNQDFPGDIIKPFYYTESHYFGSKIFKKTTLTK